MRNQKGPARAKLFEVLKRAIRLPVAAARFLSRCISCYAQFQHEYNELAQLDDLGLRDIGLSPTDVAVITRQPTWRRCWQSVRSCPNRRCRSRPVCKTECRRSGKLAENASPAAARR
jgi:uncharacterized protein YjiS (DUF1127 family)